MDNKPNNKVPKEQKPIFIYYIIGIIAIVVLNAILLPMAENRSTEEVSYSKFQEDLKSGKVENVRIEDQQVKYSLEGEENALTKYTTGIISPDKLVEDLDEANVEYGRPVPDHVSPIVTMLFSVGIQFLLIFAIGRFIMRSIAKQTGNAMQFGKSDARVYVESSTGKTFEDVAGQDEAKDALSEIVDFLHDPKKYQEIGATLPKGILLVGPPGTGKTLMAQAVAGEAGVPFFSISGSEFVEMFVGMGASKVRDLFKQAEEKAPCIVFIDEIDAIGKKRDSSGFGGNDEREQTLNQLLTEMDGFDGREGVVILGATNRPEILDPALTRPGRFDRQVRMELPDLKGREEILKVHARKVKIDPDINYRSVALMTAGSSGADLANIVNEAALRAVREGRSFVTEEDMIESVEVVIAGQKKKSMVISPKEKELIAYHEVGHALVAAMQTHSAPVTKITIIPRTSGALGYTMQVEEEEKFLMSKDDIYNKIVTLCGGRAAEEVVFDTMTTGASNDIEVATKYARQMITRFGMTEEFGMMQLETGGSQYLGGGSELVVSEGTAEEVDKLVANTILSAQEKARNILRENIDKLHEISAFLIEKETITGKEFMEILNLEEDVEEDQVKSDLIIKPTIDESDKKRF